MLTNIQNVNINKSINFYGPVINHVYAAPPEAREPDEEYHRGVQTSLKKN
jgi:hypothetical protein